MFPIALPVAVSVQDFFRPDWYNVSTLSMLEVY